LNLHRVNEVRQTEIHTAVPPVPECRAFEVEMVVEKLKKHANHHVLIKF
jgi:mannose/fructose/N-acetylgalactosamine-specific phosphotransferase system component IIB